MKAEELKTILSSHKAWLRGEAGGARADLRGANLSGANLSGADLSEADLSGASLSGADLNKTGLVYFNCGRDTAYLCKGMLRIGCQYHKIATWVAQYEKIGRDAGYTPEEIKRYGEFIKLLAKRSKNK